jgi:hypothetical protein
MDENIKNTVHEPDRAAEPQEETSERGPSKSEKTTKKMQGVYSLPYATPTVLSNILKAYVIASKQGSDAVKYSDVAAVAALHPTAVSRNNAFLSESGFIVAERYGYYKPSPETTEYAKNAPWDEAGAKQFIRAQIDKTWYGETLQQVFKMHSTRDKEQLVKVFGIKATPDLSEKNKLDYLIDFLLYFEYMTAGPEGLYTLRTAPSDRTAVHSFDTMVTRVMEGESASDVVEEELQQSKNAARSRRPQTQVNVNLNITAKMADDEIESLVKNAKAVLDRLLGDSN